MRSSPVHFVAIAATLLSAAAAQADECRLAPRHFREVVVEYGASADAAAEPRRFWQVTFPSLTAECLYPGNSYLGSPERKRRLLEMVDALVVRGRPYPGLLRDARRAESNACAGAPASAPSRACIRARIDLRDTVNFVSHMHRLVSRIPGVRVVRERGFPAPNAAVASSAAARAVPRPTGSSARKTGPAAGGF
jgi:hypothetical protein